jgi:dTDP-4-dehydrorhamnose reductase
VVSDQIGSPTWTGFLAPALVQIAETRAEGLHHLTGDGQCAWSELAEEVFRVAGLECRVVPVSTEEFPRPAPRPAWSVLGTERRAPLVLPRWQDGVAEYLATRVAA